MLGRSEDDFNAVVEPLHFASAEDAVMVGAGLTLDGDLACAKEAVDTDGPGSGETFW